MADIAVLGFGTVGSGVVYVLTTNKLSIDKKSGQDIRIKYIFDIRDFPDSPVSDLITHDIDDILNDESIDVVVEVMGGVNPAYEYVKRALLAGKSVVTSNKELVAVHGAELLAIAKEKNINFLFEASVGGGIPIIRPLNQSLTADEIYEITGILNGTTNYILTKMSKDGMDYEYALKDAQNAGYAERDPGNDVYGLDAVRKIAILSSLAFGMQVNFDDIYTEGITNISKKDIEYADKLNSEIKLIATSKKIDHGVYAWVAPVIINKENPLAMVQDVFNGILVKGNVIDEVMFYGRGAGKLPTASAVVADIVDAVKHLGCNIMHFWSTEKMEIISIDQVPTKAFIRIKYDDLVAAKQDCSKAFDNFIFVDLDYTDDEFAIITDVMPNSSIVYNIDKLKQFPNITSVLSVIRVED